MRIFNIMMSRGLGGIQQVYIDYNDALTMQGHEIINISSIFAKVNSNLQSDHALLNMTPWCIVSRIYLQVLIAKYKPDLIICHGNRAICFANTFFCSKKVPIVGVSHNYSHKYLTRCDYVLVLTQKLKQYLIQKGMDKTKLFQIPNMTRVYKDYNPRPYHKPIVIGSFGRFVENKGFSYLIEAIFLLKQKNYNVVLLLGGSGSLKEESLLDKKIKSLNLEDSIDFYGWVDDKDKFFQQIDIFCSPSVVEPFGVIVLEAMANSTPVVATRSGGPEETIEDNEDGVLADVKSSKSLANKLQRLVNSPEFSCKLSMSAYSKIRNHYDIGVVSKKLSTILNNIEN